MSKAQDVMKMGLDNPPHLLHLRRDLGGSSFDEIIVEGGMGLSGMMLYTSGTTDRPKGVSIPSSVISAQCTSLLEAWNYTKDDHLLHVLPLHHIHGSVNALLAPLFAGSRIEFLFPFNPDRVWQRFAAPFLSLSPEKVKRGKITFFTAVPTIYSRLLSNFKELEPEIQRAAREGIRKRNLRLNISGSAALPTPLKQAWADISGGNVLLERYGMTEAGMALSCGLNVPDRVDGSVGWPLPSVQVRLVELDTDQVIREGEEVGPDGRERQGEIHLRGPTIFKEYFNNPTATEKEFVSPEPGDSNGGKWFKTGDVAVRRLVEDPEVGTGKSGHWTKSKYLYFMHGRKSADIIKSGGEKVSALEVERELLALPQVSEAAVLAVPSRKWGQKVGCVLVLDGSVVKQGEKWGPMDMRRVLRNKLASYKIPQVMKVVDLMPRNAMGKVNKKTLVKAVFEDELSGDEI